MCIRDSVYAAALADSANAVGRSATFTSDGSSLSSPGYEGTYLKLPVRRRLDTFNNSMDTDNIPRYLGPSNDGTGVGAFELPYEGMMCIYRPHGGDLGNSNAHICIFFNNRWQRISFNDLDDDQIL